MAKPNYRHAKKQKEAARKARQDAKQQRRASAPGGTDGQDAMDAADTIGASNGADALIGDAPDSLGVPAATDSPDALGTKDASALKSGD